MQENGCTFAEEELISEVISKNIPSAWVKYFRMFKLYLKTCIKGVLPDLTMIEEPEKTHQKANQNNKKNLKNPCRLHGMHEWDECRKNPKNQKDDGKSKTNDNNCSR